MNLEQLLKVVPELSAQQVEAISDTVTALSQDKYVIDTYGDGSKIQLFNSYHRAVALVNTTSLHVPLRKRLPIWKVANTIEDSTASAAVRAAGELLLIIEIHNIGLSINPDVCDMILAPIRVGLGETVELPTPRTPTVPEATEVSDQEQAAREPELDN